MKRVKYLNNRDLLAQIHASKNTYCSYVQQDDSQYDLIVPNLKKINANAIAQARKNKSKRLTQEAWQQAKDKGLKKIKLADLVKGSGFEEIPKKWFNPETGESEKGGKKSIDLVLPVEKEMILKADTPDHERGLVIKWKKDGGYDVYYWYGSPDKAVPAELKADGVSKGKSVKKVTLEYHPDKD